MNDAVEMKKAKDRSPSFPYISLERALERAQLFYAQEKRGVAPYTRAVLHWGMSEASSAALQTVSALKSYGLLLEPGGSGKSRQLQLSDLALRILLDQRPDSDERKDRIREAARGPVIANEVYDKWPDLPADSTLSHYLVLERRFNAATAPSVIKILKENQRFAKLNEGDVLSAPDETDGVEVMEVSQQPQSAPTQAIVRPGVVTAMPQQVLQAPSSVFSGPVFDAGHTEQHVLRSGMKVTLHFSAQPSADTYHALARLMKFKGEDFDAQEAPQTGPSTGAA